MEGVVKRAFEEFVDSNPRFKDRGKGAGRLLVMSGPPLSGKSYICSMISGKRPEQIICVKSRDLRPLIARAMGKKRPSYDKQEHLLTFELATLIIENFLKNNWSVIADATNLREEYRVWAYEAGENAGAEIVVAFMTVTDDTARQRLATREKGASSATFDVYKKLMYEQESTDRCSKPYIIIDSEIDVRPHATKLRRWLCGESGELVGIRKPRTAR